MGEYFLKSIDKSGGNLYNTKAYKTYMNKFI